MKLRILTLLLVVSMTNALVAQDAKVGATVKGDVQKMMDSTCSGDFGTVLDMTYPKVLEKLGGKENALKQIEQTMKIVKAQGITFKVKEVGTPTIAKAGKDLYSVTGYSLLMIMSNKKIAMNSAVVGISTDQGNSWKFINLDEKGEKGVREFLPQLPADMKIPKIEQKEEK